MQTAMVSKAMISVQIIGKCICESKKKNLLMNPLIFTHGTKQHSPRFLSSPASRRKLPISSRQHFLKISPSRKGGRRNYERAEKMTKLNLWVYWLQVLMNPTIFASFLFLVSILMRHNLSRLKFFNLTNNFFSENCSVQAWLHKR